MEPPSPTHHLLCFPQSLQVCTGQSEISIDRLFFTDQWSAKTYRLRLFRGL